MLLLIDNYDSFTYNLAQAFLTLGEEVVVRRNDEISLSEADDLAPDRLVLSPGPGRPENAGITPEMIEYFAGQVPILGVCLGHQAIVQVFGGDVVHAKELMHGKASDVFHDGRTIYTGLVDPFAAGRYHSLSVADRSIPECFEITARSADGEIMGVRHRDLAIEGVQFHPESVLTPNGPKLLRNFLDLKIEQTAVA
ncbi:MAG: aminodeoxychorismate/anthranilate synthase component II [Gammaproteobacteria bacterium]